MNDALIEVLRAAGQEPIPLRLADDSDVLVLPHGGRVLGLFAAGDTRNFLWTHPALADARSARTLFSPGKWINSGGDRTWLAPEIDLFLTDFPSLAAYDQPPSLDPGTYRAQTADSEIRLTMDFSVTPKRVGSAVNLRLSKSVRATANPVRSGAVQYAGYELCTTMEALGPLTAGIGLWQLLQLPSEGEMVIPTYGACEPLVVFGQPPAEHLKIGRHELRYRMSAEGDHKISIPATFVTGRTGYCYDQEGDTHLVVRNFFVDPAGDYVDANWHDASDTGYCVQACSVRGEIGPFSEMEYHVPAITPARPQCRDVSQVWAYRGSRAEISEIGRCLLGTNFLKA